MKRLNKFLFLPLLFTFTSLFAENLPKAPNFVLNDIDNNKVVLTGLQGKVVFIDFWASWCAPCRNSIPEIENLHQKYKNKDVTFLGINLENDPKRTKEFIKNHKISYKVLIGDQQVARSYGIRGIPAFFLLNHKGEIFNSYVGFQPSMAHKWDTEIRALLKQLPPKKVIKKRRKRKVRKTIRKRNIEKRKVHTKKENNG